MFLGEAHHTVYASVEAAMADWPQMGICGEGWYYHGDDWVLVHALKKGSVAVCVWNGRHPRDNAQAELAALRARVAELESVRVTLDTPPDTVDDGVITLTITEADRAYGKGEWFGWAFDAGDYYEEQRTTTERWGRIAELEKRVAELESDYRELERVIDNMVADGRAALERLGLSRVSDGGSLKNDEAWGAVRIMEDRIRELEAAKGGSQ